MRYRRLGLLLAASTWLGCDDGAADGVGGSGSSTTVGQGDTSSSTGEGGGGGTGPVEGVPQSCADWSKAGPDPAFPGIDVARFAGAVAPTGCDKGLKGDAITLETGGKPVAVSFADGKLAANGALCTDAMGQPIAVDASLRITVRGNDGDDAILIDTADTGVLAMGSVVIDLAGGNDVVFVRATEGVDIVTVSGSQNDTVIDLDGNGGDDTRLRSVETTVVALGPGDDQFDASPAGKLPAPSSIAVCAGTGADIIQGGANKDRLEGGEGDDVLRSSAPDGADLFDGGEGNDVADFSARTDALSISLDDKANDGAEGEQDDVTDCETLVGGAGPDRIVGSAAVEHIMGGPGDDIIDGGAGGDILDGDEGNDTFPSGASIDGEDVINGGPGIDIVSYAMRGAAVVVTTCVATAQRGCAPDACACAADDGESGESDTFVNVEGAEGTPFADVMTGDDGDNVFFGNDGNDVLDGGKGNDSMFGDLGDDQIIGGQGDDYLDGGLAFDVFEGGDGSGDICIVEPSVGEIATHCELF